MRSIFLATILLAGPALALDDPRTPLDDPYKSGMWDYQQVNILGNPDRAGGRRGGEGVLWCVGGRSVS